MKYILIIGVSGLTELLEYNKLGKDKVRVMFRKTQHCMCCAFSL